ncbi:MAG: glutathione S-transferase [Geminicoccaceae bacterium]|nr:glutathione S-transferase [Geminicoccaceae bacterium]
MATLVLLIGDRATSEGSLAAYLALRQANVVFEIERWREGHLPGLDGPWLPEPPVLLVDQVPIWDSLAIGEFLAEHVPGLWPQDPRARAVARSVAHEAHAGFRGLRTFLPLDLLSSFGPPGRLPRSAEHDIDGVACLWRSCRREFGAGGPFLFGAFTLADAMFAPISLRLVTGGVPLDAVSRDYVATIAALPSLGEWVEAARTEHGSLRERAVPLALEPGSPRQRVAPASDPAAPGGSSTDAPKPPTPSGPSATVKPIGTGTRRRH